MLTIQQKLNLERAVRASTAMSTANPLITQTDAELLDEWETIGGKLQPKSDANNLRIGTASETFTNEYADFENKGSNLDWSGAYYENNSPYSMLLHMEEDPLTDENGGTVIVSGSAARSATQAKFGSYSGYFPTASDYITATNLSSYTFGSDNLTIDFWVYFTELTAGSWYKITGVMSSTSGLRVFDMYKYSDSKFYVELFGTQNVNMSFNQSEVTANTWTHMALVRNGDVFSFYVNGVVKASSTVSTTINTPTTEYLLIGASKDTSNTVRTLKGYIDEYTISKGIARWTTGFTPPTEAYTYTQYATTLNTVDADVQFTGTKSFTPSSIVIDDDAGSPITASGKMNIDYDKNGAGFTGSLIDLVSFKALSSSLFDGCTSLALQYQPVGAQKFQPTTEISTQSSEITLGTDGSLDVSVAGSTKFSVDGSGNVTANHTTNNYVRAYASGNITPSGLITEDDVSLEAEDRVALGGQTSGVDNGIYIVKDGAVWQRASFLNTGSDAFGLSFDVLEGTAHAGKRFISACVKPSGIIGTDDISFNAV